jgi:hypothetical protein
MFRNVENFCQIFLHVHLHMICVFVKFREAPIYFMVYVKKGKICLLKRLIVSIEFCLFYTRHTISRFFMKRLCGCIAREDVRLNFCFKFLTFRIVSKMHLIIKGAYAPISKNTTSERRRTHTLNSDMIHQYIILLA